ncbi:exported hypothetical protein [Streptomyces misionensis JCM 4497]
MCRTITAMSTTITSSSTPQAADQPGSPTSANSAVPKTAQTSPHTLSHSRARSALRAVAGSLPVRMGTHVSSLQRTLRRRRAPTASAGRGPRAPRSSRPAAHSSNE